MAIKSAVCVVSGKTNIIKGKEYEVVKLQGDYIWVIDDKGEVAEHFIFGWEVRCS